MENNNENNNIQQGFVNQEEQGQYVPEERYIPSQYKDGHKNPVKAIFLSFLIMLAFLAIQVVVMIPFMVAGMMKTMVDVRSSGAAVEEDELTQVLLGSVDSIALTLIATFISMLVAVLWYRLAYCRKYGFSDLKKSCSRIFNLRTVGGIILSAVSLFYISNILVMIIGMISPSTIDEYTELLGLIEMDMSDWKVIVLTVILAPINEECIMRGLIFTHLKKNMPVLAAILISALYFGIFHLNIVQGVYAAALGIFMAYLAYKYKSIIASMLFHAIFNGLNFVIALFPEGFQNSVVLAFVIPIVTGVLWYFVEGTKKIEENA